MLYEDEGDNYNYEKGQYSEIPFSWDNAKRTLTIGARQGAFDGMLQKRRFSIVLVDGRHGTGDSPTASPDRRITYTGKKIMVKF